MPDHKPGILRGQFDSKAKTCLRGCMYPVKCLAFPDGIADLAEQVYPGALVHRRPGKAGYAGNEVTIDRDDLPIARRQHLVHKMTDLSLVLLPALRVDQSIHRGKRRP